VTTGQPSTAPPSAGMIRCLGVKKAFGAHRVLNGVTCEIPEGEISVIMGPSGAGKSVLLRHLVGLLRPDTGDVIVDGKHVPRLSEQELLELRRSMGMLFRGSAMFSSMSLYDNVAFPLRRQTRKSEREIRETVMSRLAEVGLAGAEGKMPNELSDPLRERAGFARALVLEPKILLFDLPEAGPEPGGTALLCEVIREIQRRYRSTAVVIGLDTGAALAVADHVVLMHNGRVVAEGSREQVRGSDVEFTRRFIRGAVGGRLSMG
jgi:phospholipid/cholesterol/gamma-HCH transport system ATP-binding protein